MEDINFEELPELSTNTDDKPKASCDTVRIVADDPIEVAPDLSDYQCLHNFLVIWPDSVPRHKGKIVLPAGLTNPNQIEEPDEGLVLAAGGDCSAAKQGDHVAYWKNAGSWQRMKGKRVRVLRETEIYLVRKTTEHPTATDDDPADGATAGIH